MGRKEHLQEGLHEIKRKKRVEVKADKEKNPRLKTKRKMRRSTKIATLCLVVSLVACAYSVGLAFFRDPSRNLVNLDYGSVSSAVESGETYSPDRGYTPVDIFARLNWTFSRQKRWYGEMHGTVDTVIQQEIETYKQYDNGILVSADLTKSSLVSGASQFCYLKDEDLVMWRKPVGNASTYRGLETEWQTGEPYRVMTINGEDGFKAKNGLPAYELSVYVIEENTILEASDVNMTEDGLYKISYSLKPETWQEEENGALVTKGATAYYANQMIFTGGLPEAPVFESINVAFTFDKNWRVFKTEIVESYNAKYGPIAAGCVSTSETKYEYDTERAVSSAYEDYFKQYLGASVDVNGGGTGEKEVTALNCLAEAFGSVLTGPVSLDLDLTLNGTPQKGVVNLDLGGLDLSAPDFTKVSAKARLGAIDLWVQNGKAYIDYGGMKFSLKIEELVSLFGDAIAPEEGESDLLGALAGGEFTVEGSEATLSSVLPIAGVEIPVKFFFKLDENKTASLDHVETEIEIKEKLAVGAKLSFGDETLGELANEEEYVDVLPYAQSLIGLFGSDVLHLDAEYSGDGVQVKGGFDLKVKDGFALFGKLDLGLEKDGISLAKTAELLYTDGEIFVTLDGIKVKANIEETLALLSGYFELPELSLPETGTLDLAKILNEVLSEEFASRFESTKSENLLVLLVEGTELLRAFGVEFDLGTVRLSVGDDALSVDALGAKIALTAGTEFDISTDGYVDILKYASTVIELIQSDVLHADVSYSTEKLAIEGTIDFDVKNVIAKANLTLTYKGIAKEIELIYKENAIYITLDGLKLSAKVEQAIGLVEKFIEIPANDTDSKELINQLLSLNFGEVIELSESDDTLTAAIDGTKLLEALGLKFDLGQATVKIGASDISLEVLGAEVTLTSGKPFEANTDNFIDVVKYAETVIELIQSEVLHANVSYKTDKLSVAGTIDFDVKELIAKANLTLTYGEIEKSIELIYKDSTIYITLDGLKLSAKVDEAIALVENFVEIPEGDTDSKELVNKLLSLDFGEVIKLSESEDTLTAAIDGTKLLEALGLKFDLGEAIVKIGNEQIDLAVLGANVTLTEGTQFDILTDGYVDILKYAETVIELIQSEVLHADVAYKTDNLEIVGKIEFNVKELVAKANLTLTYDGIEKTIELIYKDNAIYITLDGLKLSANVEQAIALVENFVEIPANDTDSKELINNLLSLNFGEVIKLSESEDTLTAAIDGTKLLEALGLKFDLGQAQVRIDTNQIALEVLGANVTLTKGETFEANTDNFIDVVKYAEIVIELIQSEVLHANVSYKTEKLAIEGTINFDVKNVVAKANLTLTYNGIAKEIELIYKDGTIFITLDGLKLSANVEEAIALVEKFVEIPANDTDSKELINNLLSLNFGEIIKLSEENDTLTAAIDGTKLLEALGLTFDLGEATVKIGTDKIDLEVLGAKVVLTSGTPFDVSTDGYVDVLKYASTVIELIQSEVLHANVLYKTEKLEIVGTIDFDVKNVIAKANLTLTYGEIEKAIELIYKDSTIYITLDGLKLSANVEEAIALVENFVAIPANDTDSKELINNLLSLNFGEVIKLSESDDSLTAAIDGTKLLEALGLTFDLGQATVKIGASDISLEVYGANVTLTSGTQFEANTDDFIDVVKYASTVIELIQSDVLHANVSYKTDNLEIAGTIDFDVKEFIAKANLELTYNGISKEIELIYKDSTIYITLDGLKLSANVEQAIGLVQKFVEIPANDTDSKELINQLLSLNFGEVIKLSESDDSLTAAIDGTKLLEALGLTFDLGEATVKIGASDISLEVYGANVTLTAGKTFEVDTDDFIDVVKYASTVIELIQSEVLHADVSYKTDKLAIEGTIDFNIEQVLAKANLTLTYNGIAKSIGLIYKDNIIYITLDGLKLSANVEQAIGLVEKFVEIPENDTDSKELINQLLSLNFGDVIKLSESDDTLTAAIDGTKLLEALGLTFDLGQAQVKIGASDISLEVLGAKVVLTSGKAFEANTDDFIEVVKYASTVIELIQSEVLHAEVEYKTEKLAIEGTIDFDVKNVIAKANLTLTYGEIEKAIELIYKDSTIYITLDGLKLSANVEQAIALVEKFVEIPTSDTDSKELINQLLSLNFGDIIKLSEENDTLTAAIDGTKLLEALGLTFDLGEATVKIGNDQIALEVLGANVTLTKGTQFEANTDDFIDVVKYASTVIELIQSEVLHADVSYNTEKLEIVGTIDFDIKNVIAKAQLTLTYNSIAKEIELIYKDSTIYITLDGLKLSANVEQAIGLIEKFVEIPENDPDSKELINNLLSLNFGDVIKLNEENDILTAAIDGTKLLEALGLKFDLGEATVKIGASDISLEVYGANVTLTAGKTFEVDTDDFIDVVKYASTVIELIQSEVLHADVSYKTDKLAIEGTIDFNIEQVLAKANLTLTYNGIAKSIGLIYKDNIIYITLDGLKLSANVEKAIALVENFVAIPASDTDSKELINNLLSLNFGDVIKLNEENDILTAAIDGTKLLEALGLKFDLGEAIVKIGNDQIDLAVLGANVTLTSGAPFDISTDGYVDILKYASTVIELIQSEVLHADVAYKTDNLEIAGTIDFNVKNVIAKANLTLTYNGIAKEIELIYKDSTIYITLDGLKLSAKVEEAIALVENFVEIPASDTDSKELINNLLSLNFGEVIKLSEENDTLTAAIDGTKLLKALGLTFDLGEATVKIGASDISLEVLDANVTLTKGNAFEANTDDFIDVVKYAETVIELIQSEVLHADVSYKTEKLEIAGTIDVDVKDVKNVVAKANLTLTYNGIAKEIELIYKDNAIYITLDGLKLSAKVEEAIALVENFVEIPENDTDSKELINNLLSLNFGEVIKLSESDDSLTAAIDGTKLLEALGLTFDLGQATVKIGASDISLEVYGANVTLTSGTQFEANTDDFIDVVKYASTVIELIQSDVLHANVSYKTDNLEIAGTIDFDIKELIAKANLTLKYEEISKSIELIYKDSTIYITLDGLKLSANVEQAIGLVQKFVEIPANDTDSKELINQLLSLNFGEVIKLSESDNTLIAAIDGTKLLEALGLTFDLGQATVKIGTDKIDLAVLGANVTLTSGTPFDVSTDGYVDILKYASTVIELIQSDVLHADVSYKTEKLEIVGTIDFDAKELIARANLTLEYEGISKSIELIYKDSTIYITLDGLKLSAKVEQAIGLVEKFIEIPANDTDSKELINNLLSLNFGDVIKLSEENDTLTAAIDGTKLLEALGLTFDLGEATVKIGNDKIDLAVLGAGVTLTSGKAFEANTDNFIDVVKYAETVVELIQSEVLHADVSYKSEKLAIEGMIDFDVKELIAKANLTFTYNGIAKEIELIYKDSTIYITLDGLKLSANVEQAIGLVQKFVEIPANDTDSKELINNLLSLNFGEVIKLSEENDTLTAAIDGTELLKALGLTFDLGQATVKIGNDQIDLAVLGANVTLTKGTEFEANTDDFIDVVKYASTVIELIQSEVLHADVSYKTEELSVVGTIDFDVTNVIAKANLTLTYNGISKVIELIYKDSVIYITLDGLKLSAKVEEAIALVENFVEIPANDTDSKELINNLLSLNFGDVIKLSEENDTLTAAIDGTKLLEALGLKFELGNATVKIGTSDISLEVLGANVTLTKGEKFETSTHGFIDLAPVLEKIGKIVQNGGLELRGILTLDTENGEIVLEIRRAAISWKDGFKLYLDATLSVAGTAHDVKLYADKTMAKIVYGDVGVEIVYEEVKGLEAKFLQVYDRIADIVNGSFKTESGALLPKASSMKELLTSLLGKVEDTTGTLGNESMQQLFEALQSSGSFLGAFDSVKESSFGSSDLSEILGSLVLSSVLNEGTATGCITAEYKGLKLGVSTAFAKLDESLPAMVQANISYAGEGISLRESTVYLCELTSFPEMPNITYLCYEDYCELLDFFGAAITTLAEKNVGLDLSGKVLSTDEKYSAVGGEKYTFNASVRFYSGTGEEGSFPITIDTINKSISVRSDMYLKLHLTLSSKVETGLWLDLIVMDMDPNGKTDGKLDFFVSISKYEEGNASRSPLSFYAPASEVKTLLSAACILLGVDNSILNDYLIEKGLSLETRSQLQSIGDSLQLASLISGLVGKNDEPAEFAEILEGTNREENLKRNYLSKFSFEPTRNENGAINGNTLTIALNGKAIYNDANAKDIELILKKQGESFVSSRLTKVALSGVTSGSETFSFDLGFGYDEIQKEEKTEIKVTHNFDGVERLIISIAKSATHTATNEEIISGEAKAHDYVLNKTFYIDGTANVSALKLVEAEIKVIAISVTIDEENKVAVNLRLEYDGKHVVVPLINGHSIVDITIKGGMVYMKRVQTNYYDFQLFGEDWTDYDTPITIYRTTTLSNFFDDILKHLGFLLNFGDSIVSAIENSEPAQPTDTTALDYGALVGQYFVGYECKHQDGGEDTWTINLNGNALTDGVLGEIGITFTADKNDIVKDLHVSTKLYSIISLTLDLNWRNPQSADDYAGNKTDRKFADELASKQDGIGETLETHDFASERFIEYQKGVINYSYHKYNGGDESLGASDVYYRMSDRKILNEPHVPDLEEHNDKEFYLTWDNNTFYHKGGTFPNEGATVTATQKAHMYNVTFVTSNEQAGTLPSGYSWTQDGDNKSFTAQMKYNATVKFTANGHVESRQILGDMTIALPDAGQFNSGAEGEWNLNSFAVDKAEFTAFYPLTVRYKSAIAYNADGNHNADENYDVRVENSDYKLITPTASGYTFLGWFTKEGGNWREAKEIASSTVIDGKLMLKVEALWMKSGFLTIKTSKQQRSEWYLRTTYTHSATLTVHEECLVGAFAKEAGLVKSYRYWLHFDNKKDTPTSYDHSGNTYSEDKMWPAGFDYAHGKVEATFKLNSGFEFTYTETTIGQF